MYLCLTIMHIRLHQIQNWLYFKTTVKIIHKKYLDLHWFNGLKKVSKKKNWILLKNNILNYNVRKSFSRGSLDGLVIANLNIGGSFNLK